MFSQSRICADYFTTLQGVFKMSAISMHICFELCMPLWLMDTKYLVSDVAEYHADVKVRWRQWQSGILLC